MSETPGQSEPTVPAAVRPTGWVGWARGMALFFGGVFLLNLTAQLRLAEFDYDPNHWWLSFRPLPKVLEQFASICIAALFIAFAISPAMSAWRRRATRMAVELLWVLAAWNIFNYYGAIGRGLFRTSFPVPFALFVAAGLLVIWRGAGVEQPAKGAVQPLLAIAAVVVAAVIFPLLQIFSFGLLDHRGKSHAGIAAVVVFTDGQAVTSRMQTAADLYRRGGIVEVMVPGAGRGERDQLVAQGVPAENIDPGQSPAGGGTLRDAVREAIAAFPKEQLRIYAVAGFDELPRIDNLFAQEGRTAFPVPVVRGSGATVGTLLGDVGRLWKCYFSALVH